MITILIVNYNSADFIDLLLYSLKKLTTNPYKIHILDNNSKKSDYKKLEKIIKKFTGIEAKLERSTLNLTGSMAHGTALNQITKNIETPYFVIVDPDATWLKKGWDEILLNELNEKVKAIGTQADNPDKPMDFPLVFATLFETETFKKLDVDMRPQNLTKKQDVGFLLRETYLVHGFEGRIIESKNTRLWKSGPFNSVIGTTEYYFNHDYKNIFAAHFGRGSNPFGKKMHKTKIPILRTIINYYDWKMSKKRWINICKEIVANQK